MTNLAETFLSPTGDKTNIVKLPWRRFPALAIQGDSWDIYLSKLKSSLELAKGLGDEDLVDRLTSLVESFETYQGLYEEVLLDNDYELPY